MYSKGFVLLQILYFAHGTFLSSDSSDPAVTYDQRQTGHYNIHINIKDVAIFDLEGNDFADNKPGMEDYYYDDADFTIKPISSWLTSKPTTSAPITPPSQTSSTALSSIASTNVDIVGSSTPTVDTSSISTAAPIIAPTASPIDFINTPSTANDTTKVNSTQQINSELPRPIFSTKKPNVVILDTDVPSKKPPMKQIQIPGTLGTLIPVQIITDPRLQQRMSNPAVMRQTEHLYRGAQRQAQTAPGHGCRRGQFRDASGNCQNRRSSVL